MKKISQTLLKFKHCACQRTLLRNLKDKEQIRTKYFQDIKSTCAQYKQRKRKTQG